MDSVLGSPFCLTEHNYIQVRRNLQYFKMRHKKYIFELMVQSIGLPSQNNVSQSGFKYIYLEMHDSVSVCQCNKNITNP